METMNRILLSKTKLKYLLLKNRKTQKELASEIGISRQTFWNYVGIGFTEPYVMLICDLLNCTREELM